MGLTPPLPLRGNGTAHRAYLALRRSVTAKSFEGRRTARPCGHGTLRIRRCTCPDNMLCATLLFAVPIPASATMSASHRCRAPATLLSRYSRRGYAKWGSAAFCAIDRWPKQGCATTASPAHVHGRRSRVLRPVPLAWQTSTARVERSPTRGKIQPITPLERKVLNPVDRGLAGG